MYTTRAGKDALEAQNVHKCWPMLLSVSLVLLFFSRAVYNIIAVRISDVNVFGDGSTFTTDMVSTITAFLHIRVLSSEWESQLEAFLDFLPKV